MVINHLSCKIVTAIEKWFPFSSAQRAKQIQTLTIFLEDNFQLAKDSGGILYNIASGTQDFSLALQKMFPNLAVYDFDIAKIPLERTFKNFIQCDYHRLPVNKCSADFLFCFFGLDYAADRDKAVTEWQRILKPGGRALLMLHSPYSEIVNLFNEDYLFNLNLTLEFYEAGNIAAFTLFAENFLSLPQVAFATASQEDRYNFLKNHRDIVEFLLSNQEKLFENKFDICHYFASFGFKNIGVYFIENSKGICSVSDGADYQNTPHDGWLVALEK